MTVTVYGPGGYDTGKPANNVTGTEPAVDEPDDHLRPFDEFEDALDDAASRRLGDALAFAKGGVVGTSGKPAVALRFDDDQDDIITHGIIDLLFDRGIPASIALCSELGSNPWNQVVTWDDLREWNRYKGMEFWSHGTDHNDPSPDGWAGVVREVVTSKEQIEAQGIRCIGWAAPGVGTNPGYGPPVSSGYNWDTPLGRLLLATYPLTETDETGFYRHGGLRHGLAHATISDGVTKAAAIAHIDACVALGYDTELMTHAGTLVASGMGLSDWTDVIDYLVALRDAGTIEIVTPSSLPFVNHDSSHRLRLVGNGDFSTAAPLSLTVIGNWRNVDGTLRYIESIGDGPDGGATGVLRINNSGLVDQVVGQMTGRGLSGLTLIFEGYVRAVEVDLITTATGRFYAQDAANAAALTISDAIPCSTAGWTHVRRCFSTLPTTENLVVSLGRTAPVGSGQVQWANVSLTVA